MGSRHDLSSQRSHFILFSPKKSEKGRAYYEADPVFKFIPVMSSSNLQG